MLNNDDARRLLELEQEQLKRAWCTECRSSFVNFCTEALAPRGESPARHHRLICQALQDVAEGRCKRLMILAPPGSAKTTYTSRLFPAWYFAFRPRSSIIACSHTQGLSELNSGFVQRFVRENAEITGYNLIKDPSDTSSTAPQGSISKERWYTDNHCAFRAGSVGSAILGFRCNLAIIDDPIAGRAEAESETYRESTWQWFVNDLVTRLTPDGAIILIMTPFHEDDLAGRLQRLQKDDWRILRLPAIADEPDDPLGRQIGAPLWDDDQYGYGPRLLEIQAAATREGRSRDWYAQYQGRPRPPEGAMFKPLKMPVFDALPNARVVDQQRGWDLAASSGRGDWTVGVKLVRLSGDPRFKDLMLITDVQRIRGAPEEVRHLVRTVAEADGRFVKQLFPRDPGQAGVEQAESYVAMLRGSRVMAVPQTGSKSVRADAVASQANIGQIGMLRASWNAALIDELAAFPNGQHDDQVDALSLAFNQMSTKMSNLERWIALSS
jgi:predicted phage terminase large subunit-like protein